MARLYERIDEVEGHPVQTYDQYFPAQFPSPVTLLTAENAKSSLFKPQREKREKDFF